MKQHGDFILFAELFFFFFLLEGQVMFSSKYTVKAGIKVLLLQKCCLLPCCMLNILHHVQHMKC